MPEGGSYHDLLRACPVNLVDNLAICTPSSRDLHCAFTGRWKCTYYVWIRRMVDNFRSCQSGHRVTLPLNEASARRIWQIGKRIRSESVDVNKRAKWDYDKQCQLRV